jgi:Flp pilus assembly protein TadD
MRKTSRIGAPVVTILFVTLLLLVGCASLKERAQEQMKNGGYEAAVDLYEKALRNNPQDGEAAAGLAQAPGA